MKLLNKVSLAASLSVMLSFGICVTCALADQPLDSTPTQQQEKKPIEPSKPSTQQEPLPQQPNVQTAILNCPTVMVSLDAIPELKGLIAVEVLKTKSGRWKIRHDRKYTYQTRTGSEISFARKLKKVPDLRTQEQIHPKAARWRERIMFWGPIMDFSTSQVSKAATVTIMQQAVHH